MILTYHMHGRNDNVVQNIIWEISREKTICKTHIEMMFKDISEKLVMKLWNGSRPNNYRLNKEDNSMKKDMKSVS
jgi:hypothetical protein